MRRRKVNRGRSLKVVDRSAIDRPSKLRPAERSATLGSATLGSATLGAATLAGKSSYALSIQTGGGWMSSVTGLPWSLRPLPASRLISSTVMS